MATFGSGDALLIVDVQNDFCPGGALPIAEGDQIVPVVNDLIAEAVAAGIPIFASRDWHPSGHISFESAGGPWPVHCLQDTNGAAFHEALALPDDAVVVTKGVRFDQDQNSALDETGLATRLRSEGVKRLWVAGLALDVCVKATVLDARAEGFDVTVVGAATRGVDPTGVEQAERDMLAAGAVIV